MGGPKRHRPRGHIRELPSGSFQVIVYAGTDPLTKKPRYIRFVVYVARPSASLVT